MHTFKTIALENYDLEIRAVERQHEGSNLLLMIGTLRINPLIPQRPGELFLYIAECSTGKNLQVIL